MRTVTPDPCVPSRRLTFRWPCRPTFRWPCRLSFRWPCRPSGPSVVPRPAAAVGFLLLGMMLAPLPTRAQTYEGDFLRQIGGGALGFYSGSMLGLVGTMMPCNRVLHGGPCVASGVGTGAAMGMVMGALIGGENTLALDERFEHAGVGALVGAAVGMGLRSAVRQYGWADVGAATMLGGAFGAAPTGSLIGTGAGAVTGALVWWLVPGSTVADMVMMTMVGAAVGGLLDWGEGAATAKRDRPDPFPVLSIRIR